MKIKKAFTLVEVLISLAISSFIILGCIQLYRNMVSFLDSSQEIMRLNKKVCLLFNQLENDISSSFIPFLHEEEKKGKEEEKGSPGEKKKEKPKDIKYFFGEIYEDEYRRIEGKRWELFKSLNFVCTNPLQIYGENRPRIVRLKYELKRNKEKSQGEKISYDLFRLETYELENVDFKEPEERRTREKEKLYGIRSYVIAENIKDFFVEYVTLKPKKEKTTTVVREEEEPEVRNFEWNTKIIQKIFPPKKEEEKKTETKKEEEIKYIVPRYLDLIISFWDEKLQNHHSFNALILVFSYPTQEQKKDDKKESPKTQTPTPGAPASTPPAPPTPPTRPAPPMRGV